jgi:DNA-binding CsgD family transcriptional regulator
MNLTYITTKELAERIHYDARTIRNQLKTVF